MLEVLWQVAITGAVVFQGVSVHHLNKAVALMIETDRTILNHLGWK